MEPGTRAKTGPDPTEVPFLRTLVFGLWTDFCLYTLHFALTLFNRDKRDSGTPNFKLQIILSGRLLQAIGDPELDDRLARDAEASGFPVEGLNHPDRKVDVDPFLLTLRASCLVKV